MVDDLVTLTEPAEAELSGLQPEVVKKQDDFKGGQM